MSDAPQGPNWWQASDNRWYPPESHPNFRPPPPPVAAYTSAGTAPEGSPTPRRKLWPWAVAGGFALLVLLTILGALVSPKDDENVVAREPVPTTEPIGASVAPTTAAPTTLPATTVAPTSPPTTAAPATAPQTTAAPAPEATAPPSLMPNVVCMNLQAAQDLIQTTGVFFSRSNDATGQGRMQVVDSNWVVVGQSPSPGTPIGEGDAVLDVVKYGEPGSC